MRSEICFFQTKTTDIYCRRQTFETGIDHPLQKRATEDLQDASVSAVHSRLGLTSDDVTYKSGFSAETASHGYVRQQVVSV